MLKLFFSISFLINPVLYYLYLNYENVLMKMWGSFFVVLFVSGVLCCAFFLWFFDIVKKYCDYTCTKKWYNCPEKMTWPDVINVMLCDPLSDCRVDYSAYEELRGISPCVRFFSNTDICDLRKYGITIFFMVFIVILILFSFDGMMFAIFSNPESEVSRKDSLLGVLVTAVAGIVVFIYNIRLKARTENRMKWIETLRAEMSRFFSATGWHSMIKEDRVKAVSQGGFEGLVCRKYIYTPKKRVVKNLKVEDTVSSRFELISRLELLLNPSEKDHRALITLMRFCLDIPVLSVDHVVLCEIGFSVKNRTMKKFYDPCRKEYNEISADELLSMVFRLAQFVLKKEWEQVKFVK